MPRLSCIGSILLMAHPVDDLAHYFSTLHPYSPPSPLSQSALITPTATTWASLPATMPDAEQAVDEFLTQMEHRQQQQQQQQAEDNIMKSTSSTSTSSVTSSASPGTDPVITADAILDPLLDASNAMHLTSVLRKRRIKMRKHKYKKLRKRTRALRKKLGK
ncbi:hypothetical protein BGZ50_005587 [Haplosporangium sp. Z 11]|nr:hypothetical protein BGZ50_005587 [Haplosporangium sp. Z 11]